MTDNSPFPLSPRDRFLATCAAHNPSAIPVILEKERKLGRHLTETELKDTARKGV